MKSKHLYSIAAAIVFFDQLTKLIADSHLPFGIETPVVGRIVYLTAVHNRGGAFGVLQSCIWPLVLVAIAVIGYIIVLSHRQTMISRLVGVALAFQLGGALGNLIDRLRFGYVIDFIDFRFWPVFNLADMAITSGVLLLAYHLLFRDGRSQEKSVLISSPSTKE